MLTYEILWRPSVMRLMTLKHYSVCMLSLHTHHVHDMCLRCVGMLRTGVGRDVVTCFQPRHLGTQLELANRDHSILTLLEDRTVGTSRSNRMTGGRNKDAVTGLPRQMGTQLDEAMERENQIYIKQYNSATSERKAELEGKIEIVNNQVQSQLRTLESLREDAIEQANQDGVLLMDAQLRNVV